MKIKKLVVKLIVVSSVCIITACSNLATVRYSADLDRTYSESELSSLIGSIQSQSTASSGNFKINSHTPMTVSPGDRLVVDIADGEHFNGVYEINLEGTLHLPYASPIYVVGHTIPQIEEKIKQTMINDGLLRVENAMVSCRIQQWSAVKVLVSGAVFSPGAVVINNRSIEHKNFLQQHKSGDFPQERFLTTAIRSAGGIRPDANIQKVQLVRDGIVSEFNISGVLFGNQFEDIPLVAGDQIIVPSIGLKQRELMRPSRITPPGFQIFISNLSKPSDSNAQSAIGKISRSIPFGTRLLRGLISANCVGGTISTNASRVAILVTTDWNTGQTRVIQRSIEDLVRNHNRDEYNPHLMPNDGIACYDSNLTNARDVAKSLSDFVNPIALLTKLGEGN